MYIVIIITIINQSRDLMMKKKNILSILEKNILITISIVLIFIGSYSIFMYLIDLFIIMLNPLNFWVGLSYIFIGSLILIKKSYLVRKTIYYYTPENLKVILYEK